MTLASTEAASSVPLEISKTVDGHLVARVGGVWLEDPEDPVASARVFMTREQAKGVELVVLVGGGTGHRVTRLRELGVRHVVVHEPLAALRAQIRGPLAPIFRGSLLTSTPKELAAAVRQTVARPEGTRLVTSAGYAKLFPDLLAACAEPVRQGLAAAREAFETGRHRASLGTEQLAANVHRLPGKVKVGALAATRPLEGKPAFIVAAGPSLDGNAALVAEAQRRGPVFAVNTAARAIEHRGARVDVLVGLEPLPLGDPLSVSARAILCDVSSHPSTLEASLGATLV
ncbi:MAG: 6-hydroxymethylpterin diphosphokinase MptE-like protein, partial [Myxococcota bacterium]